jgi:arabinan endo-1,5-alpha-L-arabinosidase
MEGQAHPAVSQPFAGVQSTVISAYKEESVIMLLTRKRWSRGKRPLVTLAVAGPMLIGLAVAAPSTLAASYPLPVISASGLNLSMPDPGVYLYNGTFYEFSTGTGLQESHSSIAAGPWTTPANELDTSSIPSWIDYSKGFWAPDMIRTTSGEFVVYFSAALAGIPSGNPAGSDADPAGGARCIGTAESSSPTGPFSINPAPLVCFSQYGAADNMTGDPASRVLGEGVVDASPVFVTISGSQELFLVYKTQGDPGSGQTVTIRMVRLSDSDGTTVLGDSHQLLYSSTGSFSDTIEGPSLIQNGSYFILFVAAGNYDSCGYSTEWFKSQHIWSWTNDGGTTLLDQSNTGGLCGPGGADVSASEVAGQDRIFFHGWVADNNGTITTTPESPTAGSAARVMYAAVLTFGSDGYTPIIGAYQGQ